LAYNQQKKSAFMDNKDLLDDLYNQAEPLFYRPLAITLLCIVGWCLGASTLVFTCAFILGLMKSGNFTYVYGLEIVRILAGMILLIGLWNLRKWAVYPFLLVVALIACLYYFIGPIIIMKGIIFTIFYGIVLAANWHRMR
jgi:hypothetical protein